MKRRRFIATIMVSAALTGGVLTACNNQAQTSSEQAGGEAGGGESRGTLVMATSADYPPYEFVETAGGTEEIVGFDVDIARSIAERLGYELEINNIDFNGLIPALQADRADFVMAGMTPTEERKQNVDFSNIYYDAKQTIVASQDSGITAPADLDGKKVGVQLGSIQEGLAKDLIEEDGSKMELVPLNRINEIVQELKSGRIDAAIIEDTVAQGFLQANPDLVATEIPEDGPSGSAIAFPKGSELVDEFNTALQEMETSGEIEELVKKWFGDG
ncbi:MAG TPA: transporter substrate-binding domain-containing protein [Trichocoleus sp.]